MAQNVKDCALLQEVISSFDAKDSTSIDFKRSHYSKDPVSYTHLTLPTSDLV